MKIFRPITLFKFLWLLSLTLGWALPSVAQCTFGRGDIAFTGYNSKDDDTDGNTQDDRFSFVLLKDMPPSTVIYFTDLGWTGTAFQVADKAPTDAVLKWTSPASQLTAGTQVTISCRFKITASSGTVNIQQAANDDNRGINLGLAGDQLFAFTGSVASPVFLAGININRIGWDSSLSSDIISASGSVLPGTLSSSAQNLTIRNTPYSSDNWDARYNQSVMTGSAASILTALNTLANWNIDRSGSIPSTVTLPPSGTFTISPASITVQPVDVNKCSTPSFSVTAANACSYQWEVKAPAGTFAPISGGVYSGSTTATLNISNATNLNGYQYRVIVQGVTGSPVTSTAATLNPTIVLNNLTLANGVKGATFTAQTVTVASNGVAPFTFSATGLPAGMSINSTSGAISGKPTVTGTFNPVITVTGSCGNTGNATYPITVKEVVLSPAGPALTTAKVGAAYSQNITASDGIAPYSYSVTLGSLPAGLTLSTTGVLSGTPTAGGNFNFTITGTDKNGGPGSTAYTLTVDPPTIVFPSTTFSAGKVGAAYSESINPATGGTAPYSYAVTSGALPAGLTLSSTGLSGIPTEGGTFNFTVTVTDASTGTGAYTAFRAYTLTINAPVIVLPSNTWANGTVNTAYSASVNAASGGTVPYTYSVTGGTLPAGITLSANGVLSGTPTEGGTFNFDIQAMDGSTGTGPYSTTTSNSVFINKLSQTITLASSANINYGDADYDPGASSTSALPVTYTSSDPAIATIVAGKVHITGTGTVTIFANQGGNAVYNAAAQKQQILNIAKATLTINANPASKIYGDANPVLSGTVTGFKYTDDLANATTGTLVFSTTTGNNSPVGTYAITGSGMNAANYMFIQAAGNATALSISPKPITVTVTASQNKIYGQTDPAFVYTITSGGPSLVGSDTFTGGLSRVAGENAGSYAINQGTLTAGSNYTLTYQGANFAITAKPVTVTANAGQTKVYGQADPVFTYTITNGQLETGDALSGSLDRTTGENAGTYAINQGTLTAGSNYTLTYQGANFAITAKPITVTANAGQTKVYGQADPAFAYAITSGQLETGDALSGSLSRTTGENAGTYAINQGTLTAGSNYTLTYQGANFAITAKPITVTANAGQTKIYGQADPAFTYTITSGGLETGDALSGSLDRTTGENVGTYAINQGTLTAGSNYTLTYQGANFAITAKPVTVAANAGQTKVYGQADPVFAYTITNGQLETGDAFSGSLNRTTGENVGTYAINQGTLTAGSNYTLTYQGTNFAITAKSITVTANAGQTKVYGQADPVFAYTITSGQLETGDALSGILNRTTGENAGTYAINQGTLTAGTNYVLTYQGADFTIDPKAITISANASQSKIYGQTDPVFTYAITNGQLVGSDTFSGSLDRAAGENAGTYAINQGTLTAGANYALTYQGSDFVISPKAITVTAAANQSKVYGQTDPVLAYAITSGGPSLVGTDTFTGSLSRASGEAAGSYAVNQGTLTAGTNYTLTYQGANFAITAKPITVMANAGQTKVYGQADPIFAYTITNGVLVGSDTFNGNLGRVAGENAGTYAINQGTLTAGANYTLTYQGADFAISPKAITITANAGQGKVYGQTDPSLTFTANPVLNSPDIFNGSLSRTAGETVGTYAINQGTLAAGPNYTLTYQGANFAITAKPITVTANTGQTKVYGQADPVFAYAITSGGLVGGDALSGSLNRATGENAGTYAINQGTLTAGANYALTYQGTNFVISPKAITLTATANQSKVYGQTDPVLAYAITSGGPSLVGTDTFTGNLSRATGETVGSYAINQGTLTAGANYTLTYQGTNFAIAAKPIIVTATAGQSKVYGQTDPALTYTITSGGSLVGADVFSGKLSRQPGENTGAYAISQGTLTAGPNYTLSYAGANFSIKPAALAITAEDKTRFTGEDNPELTARYAGFVNGESNAVLTAQPTLSTTAAKTSPAGNYPINVSGASAINYTISYVAGTLTVKQGAPTGINLADIPLYENRPAGTAAGTLSSTSPDPAAVFTYSLVSGAGDTDNNLFSIGGNQIRTTASLDYETKSTYSIRVRSTTQYGLFLEKEMAIKLLDVNEAPTINAVASRSICYTTDNQTIALNGITAGPESGQSVTLSVSSDNPDLFDDLRVVKGAGTNGTLSYSIKAGKSGKASITLTAKDNGGTANGGVDSYSITFDITVNALPVVAISSDKGLRISKGETAILTATGGSSYRWATASGISGSQNGASLTVRPAGTTTYEVVATNASGCTETQSITIEVSADYQAVNATNVLSPNGDGVNDKFVIKNLDMYPNNELKIFDRAGRILYQKKGYDNSWDGTINGTGLSEGTYYYIIDFGPGQLKKRGFITILGGN